MPESQERKSIVIVGGGIIGSCTAYFLTRHPSYSPTTHSVTLLEATGIASAASGKAGGLLALWAYPACLVPLSFGLHRELAAEHNGEVRWGYRGVGCGEVGMKGRSVSQKVERNLNGSKTGALTSGDITSLPAQEGKLGGNISLQKRSKESHARMKSAGFPDDLDWFGDETALSWDEMGTPQTTAQVHPYQFTTSMAQLAEEKGVKVVMGKVTSLNYTEKGVESVTYTEKETVQTKTIAASDVIVTAGPWTKTVWPKAPIGGLRAHSVTIKPTRPVSAYAVFTSISLPKNFKEGTKSAAKYVSPEIYARPNDEVYACGEGDQMVPLPESADMVEVDQSRCQDIIDYVGSVSDELKDGEVKVRQACYLPQTEGVNGPLVGPTSTKGVWLASGHTCWGIQNGPGTGKIMSEWVMDGKVTCADVRSLNPRRVL